MFLCFYVQQLMYYLNYTTNMLINQSKKTRRLEFSLKPPYPLENLTIFEPCRFLLPPLGGWYATLKRVSMYVRKKRKRKD